MIEERKACIVMIRQADGSLGILDALGNLHQAKDPAELWQACETILDSDSLPEIVKTSMLQLHVESAADKAAEIVASKAHSGLRALAPIVAPVIKGVSNGVARMMNRKQAHDRQQSRDLEVRAKRSSRRDRLIASRGK